jgi:hypothetical protein
MLKLEISSESEVAFSPNDGNLELSLTQLISLISTLQ